MTMCDKFATWREAYDFAVAEVQSEPYRNWGWVGEDPHPARSERVVFAFASSAVVLHDYRSRPP